MQTFEQRINDQTKSKLDPKFIEKIFLVAADNCLSPTQVWEKWRQHSQINEAIDQSPTFSEFIEWNKLKKGA